MVAESETITHAERGRSTCSPNWTNRRLPTSVCSDRWMRRWRSSCRALGWHGRQLQIHAPRKQFGRHAACFVPVHGHYSCKTRSGGRSMCGGWIVPGRSRIPGGNARRELTLGYVEVDGPAEPTAAEFPSPDLTLICDDDLYGYFRQHLRITRSTPMPTTRQHVRCRRIRTPATEQRDGLQHRSPWRTSGT